MPSAGGGKITLQDQNGRTSTFEVAPDAKISRDGQPCKLEDVQNTDSATVTTDNKMLAKVVAARSGKASIFPTAALPAERHEGTCVSAGNGKITIMHQDGKTEKSFTVADDAKITRGGEAAKLDDLKKGDKVTVTTERKLLREVATEIEATPQG